MAIITAIAGNLLIAATKFIAAYEREKAAGKKFSAETKLKPCETNFLLYITGTFLLPVLIVRLQSEKPQPLIRFMFYRKLSQKYNAPISALDSFPL